MQTALAIPEQAKQLTGPQKVAVLCLAVGPELTSRMMDKLTPEEVEAITLEVARLETVSGPVADAVLYEWLETSRADESLAGGGVEYAREILEQAFGPQRAGYILKRIEGQLNEQAGLHRLRKVDPQQLGHLLRQEHPQTLALILAHLDPQQTAAVLKEIEPSVGASVIYRMAMMEKVSPEMLELIETVLGPETELNLSQKLSTAGGPEAVAAVLNLISPSLEKELLDGLEAQDHDLCEKVKNLMFVFEDLISLDVRSVQRVLREVDSKELALALKAASDELKAHITGSMSKRAVEALKEEMEFLGPVRVRDVEAAQLAIVVNVRQLEEAGEIVLSMGGDDEIIL